jgi:hypothetical protein
MSKEIFEKILEEQIGKLAIASKKQRLDLDDIRTLDLLTKIWKSLKDGTELDEELPKDLTREEILELARAKVED